MGAEAITLRFIFMGHLTRDPLRNYKLGCGVLRQ
jgi:hypothetical protein